MRRSIAVLCLLLVSACAVPDPSTQEVEDLGDFRLCYTYTFAGKAAQPPQIISRRATSEEWEAALLTAIRERFERYDGDKCYYIAASVEGYGLGQPGVPLVASPQSALKLRATIWDHELQKPLNKGGDVLEIILAGSGWFSSREEQLAGLAGRGALEIERFMLSKPEWFDGDSNADIAAASEAAAR